MCCHECNLKEQQRRVAENRKRLDAERYEYVAVYGQKTLVGTTFSEVGDALAALGYQLALAREIADKTVRVPHPSRKPAAIRKVERARSE